MLKQNKTRDPMYGTILAVDDNHEILTALKICLRSTFRRVLTLDSPERILTVMQQEAVDIVLLDMNFVAPVTGSCPSTTGGATGTYAPDTGREGLLWLGAIKKRHPNTPVVLITAYADVHLAVKALKSGAADFITKPWDNEELLRKLKDAIDATTDVTPLDEVEAQHIRLAVDQCHGNISRAAEMLGITRQTLYAKMRRYGYGDA